MTPADPRAAVTFLEDAARYFENRDTKGEDRAHWANVYNARNCREIAELIRREVIATRPFKVIEGGREYVGRMPEDMAERMLRRSARAETHHAPYYRNAYVEPSGGVLFGPDTTLRDLSDSEVRALSKVRGYKPLYRLVIYPKRQPEPEPVCEYPGLPLCNCPACQNVTRKWRSQNGAA